MTARTRRRPGIDTPGAIKIIGRSTDTPEGTPDRRRLAAAAIDVAGVLVDLDGKLDGPTLAQVEARVSRTVAVLLAVEGSLSRGELMPRPTRPEPLSTATPEDKRVLKALRLSIGGWEQVRSFRNHLRREKVLALLTEEERQTLAEIEQAIHGGGR